MRRFVADEAQLRPVSLTPPRLSIVARIAASSSRPTMILPLTRLKGPRVQLGDCHLASRPPYLASSVKVTSTNVRPRHLRSPVVAMGRTALERTLPLPGCGGPSLGTCRLPMILPPPVDQELAGPRAAAIPSRRTIASGRKMRRRCPRVAWGASTILLSERKAPRAAEASRGRQAPPAASSNRTLQ